MYDAVNAVHHREYQPFYYSGNAGQDASEEAAAAAAAHRILVNYFPAQQAALDVQFQSSLNAINASARVKTKGMEIGEAAAVTSHLRAHR